MGVFHKEGVKVGVSFAEVGVSFAEVGVTFADMGCIFLTIGQNFAARKKLRGVSEASLTKKSLIDRKGRF